MDPNRTNRSKTDELVEKIRNGEDSGDPADSEVSARGEEDDEMAGDAEGADEQDSEPRRASPP